MATRSPSQPLSPYRSPSASDPFIRSLILSASGAASLESVKSLTLISKNLDNADVRSVLAAVPWVEHLCLSFNQVTSLEMFQHCHNLISLSLRFNQIRDMRAELNWLKPCQGLKRLSLDGNPGSVVAEGYEANVREILPNVTELDRMSLEASGVFVKRVAMKPRMWNTEEKASTVEAIRRITRDSGNSVTVSGEESDAVEKAVFLLLGELEGDALERVRERLTRLELGVAVGCA